MLSETSSSRPGGYRLFSSSRPPTEMKQSGLGMVFQHLTCRWEECLSVLQSFIVGIGVMQSVELSGGAREDKLGKAIFRCEF